MKKITKRLGAVLPYMAMIGCGGQATEQTTNNATPDSKAIFTAKCQLCHGADGKMGLNGAKDLSLSTLNLEQRTEVIRLGRNTMPAFEALLSKEEIAAVAAYTQRFK